MRYAAREERRRRVQFALSQVYKTVTETQHFTATRLLVGLVPFPKLPPTKVAKTIQEWEKELLSV